MSRRTDRVNVLLREEVSKIIATELNDPRLSSIVSVTHVEVTPDLRYAKVFVSVLGDQEAKSNTLRALKSGAGFIQRSMRRNVTLRNMPMLSFHIDESIERGAELLELIRKVTPHTEPQQGE